LDVALSKINKIITVLTVKANNWIHICGSQIRAAYNGGNGWDSDDW